MYKETGEATSEAVAQANLDRAIAAREARHATGLTDVVGTQDSAATQQT